jgi:hypothetical protein
LASATLHIPDTCDSQIGNQIYPLLQLKIIFKMRVAWQRLIRFEATDGRILYGEPILPSDDYDLGQVTENDNLTAKLIKGKDIFSETGDTHVSHEVVRVKRLLGPLAAADVPILRCVGLNYAKHSE